MPDLRSELEKVITAWEAPAQPETNDPPQPTHNTMDTSTKITYNEILFNFVRDNPGLTTRQIEERVTDVPKNSISSLLAQMSRRHLLIKSGGSNAQGYSGVYSASTDKYMTPAEQLGVGRGHRMSRIKKKRATSATKYRTAPAPQPDLLTPPPAAPQLPPIQPVAPQMRAAFDFDVESLTIAEARALRDKLNALFGA